MREERGTAYWLAFAGTALLFLLPPFFRGLFFAPEQQKAFLGAVLVFGFLIWWKHERREYAFLTHPLDYLMLALPAVYILSAFQAANTGSAVTEVVKNLLYFLVYWAVVQLVRNEKDLYFFMHAVYVAAVGAALAGLATATGIINIPDGFVGGRIYSSFQYPNALASYLALATFLGFFLWLKKGAEPLGATLGAFWPHLRGRRACSWGYFYAAGNFLLLLVLLGTKSRGGLLITAAVGVLYFLGLSWQRRPALVFHLLAAGGAAAFAVSRFIPAAMAGKYAYAWAAVLLGLVAVLLLEGFYRFWLAERLSFGPEMRGRLNMALLALAVLAAGGGVYWLAVHPALLEHVRSFWYLRNAIERFMFIGDAIEMFKERPLLGWGGGGWKEAYRAYQDYLYNSTEVHSHYLQVAVETGILGLAAIIGIWLVFFWTSGRAYFAAAPGSWRRDWLWSLMAAAAAVGGHAAIDFDLSLSALTVSLWGVLALVRAAAERGLPEEAVLTDRGAGIEVQEASAGLGPGKFSGRTAEQRVAGQGEDVFENASGKPSEKTSGKIPEKPGRKAGKAAGKTGGKEASRSAGAGKAAMLLPNYSWLGGMLGLTAVLLVFAFSLVLSSTYARTAYGLLSGEGKDPNKGVAYLQRAAAFNPFEAEFHASLASIYMQAGYAELAVKEAEAAAKRSRYNAERKAELAFAYAMAGRYEEALEKGRQAMEQAPYQQVWYEKAANIFVFAGFNKLRAGDEQAARSCFLEALQVPQRMETVRAGLSEYAQRMWLGAPLAVTPRMSLYAGQAEYFLSRWTEAERDLMEAANSKEADANTKGEAFLWLALLKDKQGRAEEAQALLEKAKAVRAEYGEQFEPLKKVAVIKG